MYSPARYSESPFTLPTDAEPFLSESERQQEQQLASLQGDETRPKNRAWLLCWYNIRLQILIWTTLLLSTVIISASLSHLITVKRLCLPSTFGSFDTGFHTDLEAAKAFTEGRLVKFAGSVAFYENGTMYREYPQGQPQYVGKPREEIDRAWDNLLYGQAIDLPTELAGKMKYRTWEELSGGIYRTGLDVFHQLHCLNYIRKAIYQEYYPPEDPEREYFMHIDHCIDYIRQALMCFADTTPVRLVWRKKSHRLIPQLDQDHTCRNFELLEQFTKQHAVGLYRDENDRLINEKIKEGVL